MEALHSPSPATPKGPPLTRLAPIATELKKLRSKAAKRLVETEKRLLLELATELDTLQPQPRPRHLIVCADKIPRDNYRSFSCTDMSTGGPMSFGSSVRFKIVDGKITPTNEKQEPLPATLSALAQREQNKDRDELESLDVIDYFKETPIAALKEEGHLNEPLQQLLTLENIRPERQAEAAAKIVRLLQEIRDKDRAQWNDKNKPASVAKLTAPEFLKEVWADKIIEGVVRNDDISDKDLVQAVRAYINGRKGQPDLGHAEGLTIVPSPPGRQKIRALSMT
jgi:hypothetical protein